MNLSSWLTAFETCRHAGEGLGSLLEYSLMKFHSEFNLDELFSTESSPIQSGGMDQVADGQRRSSRSKRPKSVLINKQQP